MKFIKYEREGVCVTIPKAESYSDCIELIRSDRFRINSVRSTTFRIIASLILHPTNSTLAWFRLCSYDGFLRHITAKMYEICCQRHNIHLPPKTRIGFGIHFTHGFCIVINEETVIGNNINIGQFVNIGTNHNTPALIADNVYIGPNVSIVEDVIIGDNVTIGAGAVITRNLPSNSTVAGVPGKVLNYDNPARYIGKRWE